MRYPAKAIPSMELARIPRACITSGTRREYEEIAYLVICSPFYRKHVFVSQNELASSTVYVLPSSCSPGWTNASRLLELTRFCISSLVSLLGSFNSIPHSRFTVSRSQSFSSVVPYSKQQDSKYLVLVSSIPCMSNFQHLFCYSSHR